jgi:hypothetical protein
MRIRGKALFCAGGLAVLAFCADPVYKVGDKVEANIYTSANIWYSCTVTHVNLIRPGLVGGYTVDCLRENGERKEMDIMSDRNHIRPDTGQGAAKVQQGLAVQAAMNAKGPAASMRRGTPPPAPPKRRRPRGLPRLPKPGSTFSAA